MIDLSVSKDELRAILCLCNTAYAFQNHPVVDELYPRLKKTWEENK